MSAGWVVGVAGIALFLFFAWLALGCPVPSRGRHRRGRLSGLLTAVKRYYGFPTGVPASLPRCSSDDWLADPPTVELPVVRPRRTAVKEAMSARRERYWQESPLFMLVSEALGTDKLLGVAA